MMASSDVYFERNAGFVESFVIGLISACAFTSAGAIAPIVPTVLWRPTIGSADNFPVTIIAEVEVITNGVESAAGTMFSIVFFNPNTKRNGLKNKLKII